MATSVEMGETGLERAAGRRLQACGLGACVGLCLYEPSSQLAMLIHVVLPQTLPAAGRTSVTPLPGKCADTALGYALAEISRGGGQIHSVRAALVGGARIFSPPNAVSDNPSALSHLEVGPRNVTALKEQLAQVGVPLCAEDTGGHGGRTVTLEAGTGHVWVRPVGLPERLLTTLGRRPEPLPAPALAAMNAHGWREGAAYGN